jgi:low temperature requirement protein LtrA
MPMRARDPEESHRASTPLELLFDLTFVVGVSAVVSELAHAIAAGHPFDGLIGYLAVFFGIWWAWMNFTWFASAFDCDDVPYRLLTMVQMGGVLVLAAGVQPAFELADFRVAVLGYVIMRIAMVAQWLRVAGSVPQYRRNALRYAIPIAVLQAFWIARLALPDPWALPAFVLLAVIELIVPAWAERVNMTPWHPHHIVERYGLFTIIVLGESVFATTTAILAARSATGVSLELVVVAAAGLIVLFACWWLYFLESDAPRLVANRNLGFIWGYGHFGVFAALAAVGAGIEVTVEATSHGVAASPLLVTYAVGLPVVLFLAIRYAIYVRLGGTRPMPAWFFAVEFGGLLLLPLAGLWLSPAWALAAFAAGATGLIVLKTRVLHEQVAVQPSISLG